LKRIIAIFFAALLFFSVMPATGTESAAAAQTNEALLSAYTPDELLQQWLQISDLLRTYGLYPYVELEQGDTGYEVTALQTRLAELGYYKKEVVDIFGNGTYNAMRAFEKDNGLSVNGIASVADQQVLFGGTVAAAAAQSVSTSTVSRSAPPPDAVSGATENEP